MLNHGLGTGKPYEKKRAENLEGRRIARENEMAFMEQVAQDYELFNRAWVKPAAEMYGISDTDVVDLTVLAIRGEEAMKTTPAQERQYREMAEAMGVAYTPEKSQLEKLDESMGL